MSSCKEYNFQTIYEGFTNSIFILPINRDQQPEDDIIELKVFKQTNPVI